MKKLIATDPARFDRRERGQFIIESLKLEYAPEVDAVDVNAPVGTHSETMGGPGREPSAPAPTRPPFGPVGPGRRPPLGPRVGVAPPARGGAGGGAAPAAGGAGFIVRVEGRLLYGRMPDQAVQWLTQRYYESLREKGSQPGLGFYIPPDDPKDRQKKSIADPVPTGFHTAAVPSAVPNVPTPSAEGAKVSTVQFPDPVTGEETANDWKVSFAFKVKLGEMPAAGSEPQGAAPPEAGAPVGAKPARGAAAPQPAQGGGARRPAREREER